MMPAWGVCRQKTLLTMKKIFLLLIAAIANGMCLMAQDNRVATLQHESGIQAFYGVNALGDAYNAAVDGDVITLSAGEFNGCNITKALTIRGEGMDKTYLSCYDFYCTISKGSEHALSLEGLRIKTNHCAEINGSTGAENVFVSKCKFVLGNQGLAFSQCNVTLIQSHIPEEVVKANIGSHVTCLNSIIKMLATSNNGNNDGRYDIQNCVLLWSPSYNYTFKHSTIKNSVILNRGYDFYLDNTCTSSHCLVKDISGFSDSWSVNSMDGVFADDYHLTESAAATYIGTDGTEVGIYGGMYPYDTTPDYPLVKKLDVVGSHKDGKLNIKINVE